MNLVWLFLGAVLLAGVLFAISNVVENWTGAPRSTDRDSDGEPDEPNGPAKEL
jgi:hypothetical protein